MGKQVLAFDFGASSGRAMLGAFDGEKITIREVHRFSNDPVTLGGRFYWDILRLWHEVGAGMQRAAKDGGFDSVSVDSWGVDYGLLDESGALLKNLRHYRDGRCEPAARGVLADVPMRALYERTGIQFAPFNTVFQLRADQEESPGLLERAHSLLFVPDLMNYFLSGVRHTDYSIASTSGLLDVRTKDWAWELIDRLGYPRRIFGPVASSGALLGPLQSSVCAELLLPPGAQVIAACGHDTASAVAAVPTTEPDTVYISCGTWSLFGTELNAPDAGEAAFQCNFTNEGGYGGKIRFLKNIMGMWLIQESRRYWNKTGLELSFADLERLARAERPLQSFIDVDDPLFSPPGDLPGRVRDYCARTGQPVPQSVGEVMQCIYGSIALKYRATFDQLMRVTGKSYSAIHMVGGGTKDTLLCQMAADACGVHVLAGPTEATVLGNVAVQLLTLGELRDAAQARRVIAASFPVAEYQPGAERDAFRVAYLQYKKLLEL